jgi:hypothetical protein
MRVKEHAYIYKDKRRIWQFGTPDDAMHYRRFRGGPSRKLTDLHAYLRHLNVIVYNALYQ